MRGAHEATQLHHAGRKRGGRVATRGARATARERAPHRGALGRGYGQSGFTARLAAFQQVLQQPGWTDGATCGSIIRWGAGIADNARKYATELVALAPDVILATGPTVEPVLQATRTVPIVFVPPPIRSAPASSIVCRGQAATPPVLCCSNLV